MTVRYHLRRDQQVPTYVCQRDGIEHAAGPIPLTTSRTPSACAWPGNA
jgi:hypothetical protein